MDRRAFVVPAAVVPLTAGAALAWRRHRAAQREAEPAVAADGAAGPSAHAAVDRGFTCACGQELRVNGEGRHVVVWPADATVSDALLDLRCPACERPLTEQLPAPGPR